MAACTEYIDTFDLGQLGERFIRYRMPPMSDEDTDAMGALILKGRDEVGIDRLRRAGMVNKFFKTAMIGGSPPSLDAADEIRLTALATLAARCRSPVVRDGFRGETIESVPAHEGPGRVLGQLANLLGGMTKIGVPEVDRWRVLSQVALDGMHPLRRKVLQALIEKESSMTTNSVAVACSLPTSTVRRQLEDLSAHGVILQVSQSPEVWSVSEWTSERWWATG